MRNTLLFLGFIISAFVVFFTIYNMAMHVFFKMSLTFALGWVVAMLGVIFYTFD